MTRVALLPSFALPHALDDVRDRILAHGGVDECLAVAPESHAVDPRALNAELAAQLTGLGTFDLVVALEHAADAAVAASARRVVLIDPPLGEAAAARISGAPLGRIAAADDPEPGLEHEMASLITDTLAEATAETDPLLLRYAHEAVAALRERLPLQPSGFPAVATLAWAVEAQQGTASRQIWLTKPFADDRAALLATWPDDWPAIPGAPPRRDGRPAWYRIVDWGEMWWWTNPQAAADTIVQDLPSRPPA